jgi:hypothetical protein
MRRISGGILVASLVLAAPSVLWAQATRTWVSGVGDDANPCSRTAPCKTFAGAISKTAAGGEIDALDPAGFGGVTITKAITLDGSTALSGVLVSGTNGITVNAGAGDRIILRGLDVNGINNMGLDGIHFSAGKSLYVENCTITSFNGNGINMNGAGHLFVANTLIRGNTGDGILIGAAVGRVFASLDGVHAHENANGVHAKGNVVMTARNSSVSGNTGAGFWAEGSPAEMSLDGSRALNGGTGIRSSGGAMVRMMSMTISGNTTQGLLAETGGQIVPFTDNLIAGNPPGGVGTCGLLAGVPAVQCPSGDAAGAACPPPVCEAPVIQAAVGPCRKCRTKHGVTTCTSCGVKVQ